MRNKLFIVVIIFLLSACLPAKAESIKTIITAPTAFINGYGGIDFNLETYLYEAGSGTAAYNNGGFSASVSYGFTDMLDVGVSFDIGDLNRDGFLAGPIDLRQPKLFARLQLLTGTFSLAAGYDARGYRSYDSLTKNYEVLEKGYYLVVSQKKDVQTTNSVANLTAGINVPDFENLQVNAFGAVVISLNDKLLLYTEYWDTVENMLALDGNLSLAAHILVAPESFGIDIGVKNVGRYSLSEFYVRLHLVRML